MDQDIKDPDIKHPDPIVEEIRNSLPLFDFGPPPPDFGQIDLYLMPVYTFPNGNTYSG